VQFGDEARHLFLEGVAVVFDFLGADVAAGREDVAVRGDFGGGGGFAEASDVLVLARALSPFGGCGTCPPYTPTAAFGGALVPSPCVVGVHDLV